jgi:hypothetical protein
MRHRILAALAAALAGPALLAQTPVAGPDWAMNATAIEACSCPMFCQCYFNSKPAGHADHAQPGAKHFCRANLAYRVNKGYYGATRLDGAKFWIATDLGDDFSTKQMEWAVLYFDKSLGQAQRDAIAAVAGKLFPVKWKSFKTAEGSVDTWEIARDGAHALLDGGRTGEVKLKRFAGMMDQPVVIRNLKYWGAPRNDGFIMMPSEVEAFRTGPQAFEFKDTNGFVITLDMTSKDFGS